MFNPPFGAAPTDSYAAIYRHATARPSSVAEVTVVADPAGGVAGGAGLIERDDMTASKEHSGPAVVLFVSGNATIVMAWNARGGAYVDQHYAVPSVIIRGPVRLRLVRTGSSYSGYYSTDRGKTWQPVATVTVAAGRVCGQAGRRRVPRLGSDDMDHHREVQGLPGALRTASRPISETEVQPARPIVRSKSAARFWMTSRTPVRPPIARPYT